MSDTKTGFRKHSETLYGEQAARRDYYDNNLDYGLCGKLAKEGYVRELARLLDVDVSELPPGKVAMPRELTAENGAKAELIGEFFEEVTISCPEDHPAAGDIYEPFYTERVPVTWTTIKQIYKRAVALFE